MKAVIYTTDTCKYCKEAKEYFKEKNIEYEEINLSKNPERKSELLQKSGSLSVPTIELNGKNFIGFSREEVDKVVMGL